MKRNRRSFRLKNYDYTDPGAYFVTICARDRLCIFGDIINGEMVLNETGVIVRECWDAIPDHFPHEGLDAVVIMPNHVHGIIVITDTGADGIHNVGAKNFSPLRRQDDDE